MCAPIAVGVIEPVGGRGGLDYYDLALCRGLIRANVTPVLYSSDSTDWPDDAGFEIKTCFRAVYGSAPPWRRGLRYLAGIVKAVFDMRIRRIRVCHLHFFHVGPLEYFTVIACRLLAIRVVITAHDVESFVADLSSHRMERSAYRMASKIIVHNRTSQQELIEKMGANVERVAIIPHGSYLDSVPDSLPTRAASRKRLGLPEECADARVVLFFGQLKKVKGLDLLIEAFSRATWPGKKPHLLIAGKPWKDDFERYREMIAERRLDSQCTLKVGYVPNDDVAQYYNSADLVVLPYRRIYQSGVLLMAMSYGVPVLASDLPGMTEILTDGENGFLFTAGDPGSLATSLERVLARPEGLTEVARNARLYVEREHDWVKIAARTASVYRRVAGLNADENNPRIEFDR